MCLRLYLNPTQAPGEKVYRGDEESQCSETGSPNTDRDAQARSRVAGVDLNSPFT